MMNFVPEGAKHAVEISLLVVLACGMIQPRAAFVGLFFGFIFLFVGGVL